MAEFAADVLAPNQSNANAINILLEAPEKAARLRALDTANQAAQQDLADRATLRGQAEGLASTDSATSAAARGMALSLPGIGGDRSAAGVAGMHADQRAQTDHAIQVAGSAAQGILLEPPDQRAAAYQQYLPMLRQLGLNLPDQYPGDASVARARDLAFSAEKRMEILSKIPVYSTGGTSDPFAMRGPSSAGAATSSGTSGGTYVPGTPFVAKDLPAGISPDEDAMTRTVVGEAADQGAAGQQAVAHVILNRSRGAGVGPGDIVFAPNQFEPWNGGAARARLEALSPTSPEYQTALANVRAVTSGQVADPTGGADHFYAPVAQAKLGRQPPSWAQGVPVVIGGHAFYKVGYGPAQPNQSGTQSAPSAGPGGSVQSSSQAGFAPLAATPGAPTVSTPAQPAGSTPNALMPPASATPISSPVNQLMPPASAPQAAPTSPQAASTPAAQQSGGQYLLRNALTGMAIEVPGKPGYGIGPDGKPVWIEGLAREIVTTPHKDGSMTQSYKDNGEFIRTIPSPDIYTLQTGDPASPEYVAAYARVAAGKAGPDGQTTTPNMRAYRPPAGYATAESAAAALGTPTVTGTRLEPAVQKMDAEDIQAIQTAASLKADLGALREQIESGKLSLGPASNTISTLRNATGNSTENSRNFASFQANLERLRNDSLRLNAGVQTDGDAKRAWNELVTNINDEGVVKQRLAEIGRLNERAVELRGQELNRRRAQNGQTPIDLKTLTSQPAAVGSGPSIPARPANVPEGSAYSPSRNQWRGPDGQLYPGGQ